MGLAMKGFVSSVAFGIGTTATVLSGGYLRDLIAEDGVLTCFIHAEDEIAASIIALYCHVLSPTFILR